ncbi:hypothetical protein [Eikenella sp. HMSC061C02]|uniref:hypothetical protein n=1 Tax=Eikenella sp. HMSC061C02 TaxID=1715021 RepID=UPI00114D073A|nr:hypothetical protein [Eikenella sp. HMSC061C02]
MNRLITTICLSTYNVWNLTIALPSKQQPSGFRTVHESRHRTHRLAELADAQIRARFACQNLIDDTTTVPSQFGDQS